MSGPEDAIIDQLLKLSEYGNIEEARIEAVKSLASYRHHPKVQKRFIELTKYGTTESIRLAAIRILGGRSPEL